MELNSQLAIIPEDLTSQLQPLVLSIEDAILHLCGIFVLPLYITSTKMYKYQNIHSLNMLRAYLRIVTLNEKCIN